MNANPYEPPTAFAGTMNAETRGPFYLAGIAALFASGYWALLTVLTIFGAYAGTVSGFRVIMPIVLVALYAMRGMALFKGDAVAAKRLIGLHIVGAIVAVLQVFTTGGFFVVLFGAKVAINVFGAITAYLAVKANERAMAMPR
jgi:hypothetical protein